MAVHGSYLRCLRGPVKGIVRPNHATARAVLPALAGTRRADGGLAGFELHHGTFDLGSGAVDETETLGCDAVVVSLCPGVFGYSSHVECVVEDPVE